MLTPHPPAIAGARARNRFLKLIGITGTRFSRRKRSDNSAPFFASITDAFFLPANRCIGIRDEGRCLHLHFRMIDVVNCGDRLRILCDDVAVDLSEQRMGFRSRPLPFELVRPRAASMAASTCWDADYRSKGRPRITDRPRRQRNLLISKVVKLASKSARLR